MPKQPRDYRHSEEALLRPEAGAQDNFPPAKRKPAKSYRFDSSLAPELSWDENEARGRGEEIIAEILRAQTPEETRDAAEKLRHMGAPFLNWAGKAEREKISVPTLPLFVHERLSAQAILDTLKLHHRKRGETLDLFGESDKSIGEKIRGAYEHLNGWQNRLILGDSLQVMNSLLEYERLGRQVQMVYMDPPYGIKFGGNFQPFVRKRAVKEGDDESLSREPEMVKAYRDTWELNEHSWLTYMRDRLLVARELLRDSGSCFVQISDDNLHFVRNILDEVFGKENFVSLITIQKTTSEQSTLLGALSDYLVWYAKDKTRVKFNPLFVPRGVEAESRYDQLQLADGTSRPLTKQEKMDPSLIPSDGKVFRFDNLTSSRPAQEGDAREFVFDGKKYTPGKGTFKTDLKGLEKLATANRLRPTSKGILNYQRFKNDFAFAKIGNLWSDISGAVQSRSDPKVYVVQTGAPGVQRCMLMTTDPGDLVLDPTCGSGTTAYVAEQWGRRWITTDVSRVPLALARQRLLTATFPYYQLKDESRGPSGGFEYKRKQNKKGEETGGIVPHITLKSIANNEPPAEEVLVDKPETAGDFARISGPFCVEAVLPTPLSPDASQVRESAPDKYDGEDENDHLRRMLRALQLSPVVQLPGNKKLRLQKIRAPAKSMNLHAEGEHADEAKSAIAIVFGPANGAISERAVVEACKEAKHKNYAKLLVIAFAVESHARESIETADKTFGIPAVCVQASPDLAMFDLLKNMRSSEIFAVVGLPDVELKKLKQKSADGDDLWQVTLRGLDVFDPVTMRPESLKGDDVPCWMLDTDYDQQCFRAGQVFFPRTAAWDKIRRAVKADFDESTWEHLRGAVSAPFVAGERVGVKVIDDRGNEVLVVKSTEGV